MMSGILGSISTNVGTFQALRSISRSGAKISALDGELASGLAVSTPADNPAYFIESQGFLSQIGGLNQSISNANQGIGLLQTAQGAVGQQLDILQKLNSIALQAANGTTTPKEAQSLQTVVSTLVDQINSISSQTQFNGINLLDGTFVNKQFQLGSQKGQTLNVSIPSTAANAMAYSSVPLSPDYVSQIATNGLFGNNQKAFFGEYGQTSSHNLTISAASGTYSKSIYEQWGFNWSSSTAAGISAAQIASQINAANIGVHASATTSMTFKYTPGSHFTGSFQLNNNVSPGSVYVPGNSSAKAFVNTLNAAGGSRGFSAKLTSSGNITITQSAGDTIRIRNGTKNAYLQEIPAPGAGNVKAPASGFIMPVYGSKPGAKYYGQTIAGQISLKSSKPFSLTGGGVIGLMNVASVPKVAKSISSINVSSVALANSALKVIGNAETYLENVDASLGAQQQRFQAVAANLTSESTQGQNALAMVQDANIPQLANQMSQTQIQAQSGVSALKNSLSLQEKFLSLLP